MLTNGGKLHFIVSELHKRWVDTRARKKLEYIDAGKDITIEKSSTKITRFFTGEENTFH